MIVDQQRAIAFIEQRGTPAERARLRHLLTGAPPSADDLHTLTADQREDGGWPPFWFPDYSSLDATCFRLAQAEQLGVPLTNDALQRAAHLLQSRQSPDGSWQEDAAVADFAPPWAAPGDPTAHLYLTANCGFWSALLGMRAAAERATTVLAPALDATGKLPSFTQSQWLAAALAHHLNNPALATRLLAPLATQLHTLPAASLTWMLTALLLGGVPITHPLIQDAATRLQSLQRADGSWPSDEGVEREVHVTLEALRALHLCNRL